MAYGIPFQSPPSRQSVAALLTRLGASGKLPGMATGGKPYVAPQNPSVATPYTGDITTYGEGPEHDFFVNPMPAPKPAGGVGTGGGAGAGGGNDSSFGGGFGGGFGSGAVADQGPFNTSALPLVRASDQPAITPAAVKDAAFDPYYDQHDLRGTAPPIQGFNPQAQFAGQDTRPLSAPIGQQHPPGFHPQAQFAGQSATTAPQQNAPAGGNSLANYLKNLQGYAGTGRARGGPIRMAAGGQSPDPSTVVAAPLQNVENIQRGRQSEQGAGLSARDQANADVAVNPSFKNSVGIGTMIAGMAMAPMASLATMGVKAAIGALTGQPLSDPFNTPGPRITPEQQQAAINASNAATGPVTNQKAAYMGSIGNSRAMDRAAVNQQNNTPLGGYGETLSHEITANFGSPGFGPVGAGRISDAGGGGGNTSDSGGGGGGGGYGGGGDPGAQGAGHDPNGPPGSHRRGGQIRNYAKGGLPRFPSIKRFDQGGSYVTDPASDQTVNSIDPTMTDAALSQSQGNPTGISTMWLPLLTGAYNMSQGDPFAGAASIGAATALLGGTPQQAMDSARLLYKSGAAQLPQASKQSFDPNRNTTNSLLSALATQAGVSNQLRAAAIDPQGTLATMPQPYQKPTARTTGPTISKATGGYVQGGEPHGVKSDGTSFAVKGPGSGQSDDINAKLSNDEHVWDATTVAALGDGSSDEGHRRLDQMRKMIRAKAGMKNPNKIMGKQPGVGQILARVSGGRV